MLNSLGLRAEGCYKDRSKKTNPGSVIVFLLGIYVGYKLGLKWFCH